MLRVIILSISLFITLWVAMPTQARDDDDAKAFFKALRGLTEGISQGNKHEQQTPLIQQLAPSELDDDAAKAAAKAEQIYGGRALAVTPYREGFRVRLLLEGGRVTTVTIED